MKKKKNKVYTIKLDRFLPLEQKKESTATVVIKTKPAKVYTPKFPLSVSELKELMIASSWILDCVNIITKEVIKFPLGVSPAGKASEIESLLQYPSITKPLSLIRKQYLTDMLLYGNGVVQIVYREGKPAYLSVIPGYTLRVVEEEGDENYKYIFKEVKGYGYKKENDKEIILSLKEIMHFSMDLLSDETVAMSPLNRIANLLKADKNILTELVNFTSDGFINPHILSFSNMGKKEIKEFAEFLKGVLEDGDKLVAINKEGTAIEIKGWTARDIIDLQRWIGLRVANVYGVPPFMLNLVEDVGSLNAREQRARFLENVILPILEYEAHLYTTILVRLGFENKDVVITAPLMASRLNYSKAQIARMLVGTKIDDVSIFDVDEVRTLLFNTPPKKRRR